MKRLFILRPEPGARASADRARQMGMDPVTVPLFRVTPVEWQRPDPAGFDALLVTSANALRCAGAQLGRLRALPVHAVGEATAAAARDAGFDIASTGDSGVERLLRSIEPDLRLLHLCGEDRRDVQDAPQPITAIAVYRAEALDKPHGLAALQGNVAAAHSPRAAARLAELVDAGIRATVSVAAISEAAASAAGDGWACVEAAQAPSDEALLEVATRLCED